MIRIRTSSGDVREVSDAEAVEFVDDAGRLAVVTFTDRSGGVHIVTPNDPVFNAYCRTHRMAQASVTVHEPSGESALRIA